AEDRREREVFDANPVVEDAHLGRDGAELCRRRRRDAHDSRHRARGGEPFVQAGDALWYLTVPNVPESWYPRDRADDAGDEAGGGAVGVEGVIAAGDGAADERGEPEGGDAGVSDEARAAERQGRYKVAALHRPAERRDRVLDQAGLEDELVDRAGRPQLVGE